MAASAYQYNLANSAYNAIKAAQRSAPPTVAASMDASVSAAKLNKLQTYAAYRSSVAARVKLSRTGGLHETQEAGQAAVDQSVASLNLTKKQIEASDMTAPIDGYVVYNPLGAPAPDGTTPKAGVGAAVSPAAAPFTVYALNATFFSAEVDETDIARVKPGLHRQGHPRRLPGRDVRRARCRASPRWRS